MRDYELECSFFEQKLSRKCMELERAKSNNGHLQEMQIEQDRLENLYYDVSRYRQNLNLLSVAVSTENNQYRERRLNYLNDVITEAIKEIFPNENYKARVICDFKRKDKAYLVLEDTDGNVHDPDICEGKLMQYLISFSAVAGITESLGGKNLFIDEAFGVAAVDILPDIGEMLDRRIRNGFQILLISQNPALYAGLPHHKIALSRDPINQTANVESEVDFERVDTTDFGGFEDA